MGVPHREEDMTRRNQTAAAGGGSPSVRTGTGRAMETSHTRRWRLSESRLAEIALLIFGALILSGPPRLRTRDMDAALEQPFSLDPAGLLQDRVAHDGRIAERRVEAAGGELGQRVLLARQAFASTHTPVAAIPCVTTANLEREMR